MTDPRTCPVCRAAGDDPCRAVDFGRLPSHHPDRDRPDETTPLYDALAAEAVSV